MRACLCPSVSPCVCDIVSRHVQKTRERRGISKSIEELHTLVGQRLRLLTPPRSRVGDVLFDGVSKREILTEHLSPVGIMWADVGGGARFDFHGISGERAATVAKEVCRLKGEDERRGRT